MKNFGTISALMSLAFLISSCTTVKLGKGPDIYGLARYEKAPMVGVAKVTDERERTRAGTIGANGIVVKDGLSDLASNHLMAGVNKSARVNVIGLKDFDEASASAAAAQYNADKVIKSSIKSLRVKSVDAILEPVEVEVDMHVLVYDKTGTMVYDADITGRHEKRLGMSLKTDKVVGEMVEEAVRDAVRQLADNSAFKLALEKA